jgi:hypothetical protein
MKKLYFLSLFLFTNICLCSLTHKNIDEFYNIQFGLSKSIVINILESKKITYLEKISSENGGKEGLCSIIAETQELERGIKLGNSSTESFLEIKSTYLGINNCYVFLLFNNCGFYEGIVVFPLNARAIDSLMVADIKRKYNGITISTDSSAETKTLMAIANPKNKNPTYIYRINKDIHAIDKTTMELSKPKAFSFFNEVHI